MTADDLSVIHSSASDWPVLGLLQERSDHALVVTEVVVKRALSDDPITVRGEISRRVTPWLEQEFQPPVTPRVVVSQRDMPPPNALIRMRGVDAVWRSLDEIGVTTSETSRSDVSMVAGGLSWTVFDAHVDGVADVLCVVSFRDDALGLLSTNEPPKDGAAPRATVTDPVVGRRQAAWFWVSERATAADVIVFPFGEFDDRDVGLVFVFHRPLFDTVCFESR